MPSAPPGAETLLVWVVLERLGPAVLKELPWYLPVPTQLTLWSSVTALLLAIKIAFACAGDYYYCYRELLRTHLYRRKALGDLVRILANWVVELAPPAVRVLMERMWVTNGDSTQQRGKAKKQ
ncbi:hypothetical protein GRJ2_001153400 [Grus japonensis]|uniref:Uncharacterized protein n=1 Tax=Grus japonensis TaxID=30415 RepID=A0ABC9WN32_GRUJA